MTLMSSISITAAMQATAMLGPAAGVLAVWFAGSGRSWQTLSTKPLRTGKSPAGASGRLAAVKAGTVCTRPRTASRGAGWSSCTACSARAATGPRSPRRCAGEHRVLLVDLPDHGRSAWTDEFRPRRGRRPVGRAAGRRRPGRAGRPLAGRQGGDGAGAAPPRPGRAARAWWTWPRWPTRRWASSPVLRRPARARPRRPDPALGRRRRAAPRGPEHDRALLPAAEPAQGRRRVALAGQPGGSDAALCPAIGSWPEEELGEAPYAGPVLWVGGDESDYITDEYAPAMDRLFPRNRRVTDQERRALGAQRTAGGLRRGAPAVPEVAEPGGATPRCCPRRHRSRRRRP